MSYSSKPMAADVIALGKWLETHHPVAPHVRIVGYALSPAITIRASRHDVTTCKDRDMFVRVAWAFWGDDDIDDAFAPGKLKFAAIMYRVADLARERTSPTGREMFSPTLNALLRSLALRLKREESPPVVDSSAWTGLEPTPDEAANDSDPVGSNHDRYLRERMREADPVGEAMKAARALAATLYPLDVFAREAFVLGAHSAGAFKRTFTTPVFRHSLASLAAQKSAHERAQAAKLEATTLYDRTGLAIFNRIASGASLFPSMAQRQACKRFVDAGLMIEGRSQSRWGDKRPIYALTPKGRAFLHKIFALPFDDAEEPM